MLNQFSRTELLLGHDAMEKLAGCRVAVFGIGGVGGYTVEALARSGVGALDLIDDDRVCLTNINRQLLALRTTVGQYKVDVAVERVRAINPNCTVTTHKCFYLPETKDQFDFTQYDYVVDAIDTVSGKLALVEQAKAVGTPIICAISSSCAESGVLFAASVRSSFVVTACASGQVTRIFCRSDRSVSAGSAASSLHTPRQLRRHTRSRSHARSSACCCDAPQISVPWCAIRMVRAPVCRARRMAL